MNKTKTFSMFLLAAILLAGTISTMIPTSFAQSQYRYVPQQEYTGYENSYGNGYDKKQATDLNIQKVKCNNIIINGVEKSHPTTGDMTGNTMTADEENDWIGQQQNHGFGNGEKKFKGFDRNIVNVCINKNNIVAAQVPPVIIEDCEKCFDALGDNLQVLLGNLQGGLNVGFPEPIGQETFFSLEDICIFLQEEATSDNVSDLLQQIIDTGAADTTTEQFEALLLCIAQTFDIELLPL